VGCSAGRPQRDARAEQIGPLQREKRQLKQELATGPFVVDVQAKVHALGEISECADTEPGSTP